jgi:hypothetical protein
MADDILRAKCIRCGKLMYAAAVVCPHCNARQDISAAASPPVKQARPLKVSREEASALLAAGGVGTGVDEPGEDHGSLVAWLLFPRTSGIKRTLEMALTLVALPLLIVTVVGVASWASRYPFASRRGTARWAVVGSTLTVGVGLLGFQPVYLEVLGGMFLAWLARGLLRGSKHKDISRAG